MSKKTAKRDAVTRTGRVAKTRVEKVWGLGLEHEFSPVQLGPDGVPFTISPDEIVRTVSAMRAERVAARRGATATSTDATDDVSERRVAIRVPPLKKATSGSRRTRAAIPPPTGAVSVFRRIDVFTINFATSEHNVLPTNHRIEPGESFDDMHRRCALECARAIVREAERAGVTQAFAIVRLLGAWTNIMVVDSRGAARAGTSAKGHTDVLPLDDEKKIARLLVTATEGMYVPARTRHRDIRGDVPGIDTDSGFVEVRSLKFVRATIASVASEVVRREREVLRAAERIVRASADKHPERTVVRPTIMPRGGPVRVGSEVAAGFANDSDADMPATLEVSYAGSFHVWLTLPYTPGAAFDHAAFVRDHSRAVVAVQWLEPLLLACMPPDPRSPGSGDAFSRASMRSRLNYLMGFGTACIEPPRKRPVLAYESMDALHRGDRPVVVHTDAVWLTGTSGERINLLACSQQSRYTRHDRASRVSPLDGAAFDITQFGTDIRFDTCAAPLNSDQSDDATVCSAAHLDRAVAFVVTAPGVVEVASSTDTRSPLSGASDDEDGTDRAAHTYAIRRCEFEPRGLEVRLFDQMPGRVEETVLGVTILAAVAGSVSGDPADGARPSETDAWILTMHDCARHGSRVPVSRAFIGCAARALGVDPGTAVAAAASARGADADAGRVRARGRGDDMIATAHDTLNALLRVAFEKHHKHPTAAAFGLERPVQFPDVNFETWCEIVQRRAALVSGFDKKFRATLSTVRTAPDAVASAVQMYLGDGWLPDAFSIAEVAAHGFATANKKP